MIEEWRSVAGWEGVYEVSNLGRVRSFRRGAAKILRPGIAGMGYPTVAFGRGNTQYVHVLVCAAFHGPRPAGMEVLHRDESRDNANSDNLHWGTRGDNMKQAYASGRFRSRVGMKRTERFS